MGSRPATARQFPKRNLRRVSGHPAVLICIAALVFAPAALGQAGSSTVDLVIRVTGQQHEQPIDQVRIELMRFPNGLVDVVFSDASGRALFSSVRADNYILRAVKAGYQTEEVRVELRRGDTYRQVNMQLRSDEPGRASAAEGIVSSRTLSIPGPALDEFRKGAELVRDKKNPGESLSHFQKAIDIFPTYREAYFLMGMAHLQMNALNEARTALAMAIELDPKFLEPYHPLSVVLFSLKRYSEAEILLRRAMELDKEGWQWPFELARCYASEGQWDKAVEYGQRARDRRTAPSKVHLLMADLYSNTGNKEKAIQELEKFMKLDPGSPYLPRVQRKLDQLRKQE